MIYDDLNRIDTKGSTKNFIIIHPVDASYASMNFRMQRSLKVQLMAHGH